MEKMKPRAPEREITYGLDLSLYLVIGINFSPPFLDRIAAAIGGGTTVVQLRGKDIPFSQQVSFGRQLRRLTKAAGIPLIINDYLGLVAPTGAEGLHVGQEDITAYQSLTKIRRVLGPNKILGVSVSNVQQALLAEKEGADYIAVSPLYSSATKPDAGNPVGLEGLTAIIKVASLPVVAIGGINEHNAAGIIEVGAAGIAVVSAIMASPSPEQAACNLRTIVSNARK